MANDLSEILEVPWDNEGSLIDAIRKDGVQDEDVEKAVVAAVRLLKGVESEFSPELVEKIGTALYPRENYALNTAPGTGTGGDLTGSSDSLEDEEVEGEGSGTDNPGSASGDDLEGSGSAPKVAADGDWDDDDVEKATFSADERKSLASQGKALPDGSFPIRNTSDLRNAIHDVGRASDPGRARSWIIRRAKALGATGMLPDSWSVSKEDGGITLSPAGSGGIFINDDERGTVETHAVPVQKEDGSWDFTDVPEESASFFRAMIQKQDEQAAELKAARDAVAKADDTLLSRSMVEKAARLNHVAPTDDLAPILKEASQKLDTETFEKLESILESAQTRISKGDLFTEMGRSGLGEGQNKSDAEALLVQKAEELVEKGGDLTFEVAYDRVIRANPTLYNQYLNEHGMGVG